jgi:uncharacterized protein
MGIVYKSLIKSFPVSGFIQDNQRMWLVAYRACKDSSNCQRLLNERIKELNNFKNAAVYADYDGNKLVVNGGTIVITDDGANKIATFFGNWMPDAHMDPDKMKGYPKDGYICNEEVVLIKKGSLYVAKEGAVSDDFSLLTDSSKAILKGSIMCNPRCGFSAGTYKRKQ